MVISSLNDVTNLVICNSMFISLTKGCQFKGLIQHQGRNIISINFDFNCIETILDFALPHRVTAANLWNYGRQLQAR